MGFYHSCTNNLQFYLKHSHSPKPIFWLPKHYGKSVASPSPSLVDLDAPLPSPLPYVCPLLSLNSLSILMFYLSVVQSHSSENSADDRIVYLASSVYVRRQLWFHRRTFFSIVHFQHFVKIIFYSSIM